MKTLGQRLKFARENRKLSPPALARLTENRLSYQAIQQLEKGDTQQTRHLMTLARALAVSPDWLESGIGTMEDGRDFQPEIDTTRAVILKPEIAELGGKEYARIPVYDIRFAAGYGSENYDETPVDEYILSLSFLRTLTDAPVAAIAAFQSDGDSMEPTIMNRDWVLCDLRKRRLTNPGIYALVFEGEGLLKRAAQHLETKAVTLISDNNKYPPQEIKKPERLSVVGRIFSSIRRH